MTDAEYLSGFVDLIGICGGAEGGKVSEGRGMDGGRERGRTESTRGRSHPSFWHRSLRSVTGLLYPTGNNGGGRTTGALGSVSLVDVIFAGRGDDFDELPALPDLTTLRGPLRGGMVRR